MHEITLHHVSLVVADVAASVAFYRDLLGLPLEPSRPSMGFDGAWLQLPGGQQIHLLQVPNPDPVSERPQHGGRDRHVAFLVRDLDVFEARLQAVGAPFTRSMSGRQALFCRDPDGNACELIQAPTSEN